MKMFLTMMCVLTLTNLQAQQSFEKRVYDVFISSDLKGWEKILDETKVKFAQTKDRKTLEQILNIQYGLIGYYSSVKESEKAEKMIEEGEANINGLLKLSSPKPEYYAMRAAFYGFRILFHKTQAPTLGKKSQDAILAGLAIDSTCAYCWLESGNSAFFRPAIFGGSKVLAAECYGKAIKYFNQKGDNHKAYNWVYINTVVNYAKSLEYTKEIEKSRKAYLSILEIEPNFSWVRNELYPAFVKKHGK